MGDKYKHIDDLFRDKLKNYELDPPDHVWDNIKQQIQDSGKGGGGSKHQNGTIYGFSIIVILAGLLTWYLLSSSDDEDNIAPKTSTENTDDIDSPSSTRTIAINLGQKNEEGLTDKVSSVDTRNTRKQKSRFDISRPVEVSKGTTSLVVNKTASDAGNEIDYITNNDEESDDINDLLPTYLIVPGSDDELLAIHSVEESDINAPEEKPVSSSEFLNEPVSSTDEQDDKNLGSGFETAAEFRSDYGRGGNWMFGVFFTPEMIFYPDYEHLNNRTYALDVNAIYKFSGYFFQSGLGVSWISDQGKCKMDYNKYLGSYEDVYHVTFDTLNNELIPMYHTETVRVYDTIDHMSVMPTKSHFTFLQIPLLVGYGNEDRRFGWFVKGGPSLSIMLHKNLSENDLSESEDKILHIENDIPSRINTSWQFVFSAGISYKLKNHLSFSAEPVFRYYLNSTYENSQLNLKNPYSFGLRVGFLFDL